MNRLPDLTGKTVLVVGSAVCDASAVIADYIIAASGGIKNAPNADMLVSIDNDMSRVVGWYEAGFLGLRVVGIPSADVAHVYYPFPYENVQVAPGNTVHARNNGISAIRLAADRGAKRVLLAGFAPAVYDTFNAPYGYDGVLTAALPALISELAQRGIAVEYVPPPASPVSTRKRTA